MEKTAEIKVWTKNEAEMGRESDIKIELPKDGYLEGVNSVEVICNQEGEEPSYVIQMKRTKEDRTMTTYCAEAQFPRLGNYYFFFLLKFNNGEQKAVKINRANNKPILLNPWEESPYWRTLVVQPDFTIPQWATDKIAYQLIVDRFCKSERITTKPQPGRNYRKWGEMPAWGRNSNGEFHNNDFFGGNLNGIQDKLDYLKSLSIGIVYMSPINESLYRYERYASTNHMLIDPDAGSFDDLKALHESANEKGMHIILDIAFNHCSSDNPIFQEALHNPNSEYRNWFFFDENGNYAYWYGLFKDMPVFNQRSKGVQEYVYGENGVVAKFAPFVDGFRLDLAEALEPFFLEGIRNRANCYGKHLILGEFWDKVPLATLGKGVDCPTNYFFTNAILRFVVNGRNEYLKERIKYLLENYPQNTVDTMFNSLETHDMMRVITILSQKLIRDEPDRIWDIDKEPSRWHTVVHGQGKFLTDEFRRFEFENDKLSPEEYELVKRRLKVAVILQYFLPGIPCNFYGTEAGLHGFKDPFNRKCYPWGSEDQELIKFYQEMGAFRSLYKGAKSSFEVLYSDQEVFAFERKNESNSVFVVVNRGENERSIDIPQDFFNAATTQKSAKVFALNADLENKNLLPKGGIIILK